MKEKFLWNLLAITNKGRKIFRGSVNARNKLRYLESFTALTKYKNRN